MPAFFGAIPEAVSELDRLIDEIAIIQDTLVKNDDDLEMRDRLAHQQQITGSGAPGSRPGRNWRRNRLILA